MWFQVIVESLCLCREAMKERERNDKLQAIKKYQGLREVAKAQRQAEEAHR